MAKSFTSASLTDEELADLDPWLQDNLGELDKGQWIIERNEKTGKVEAVMIDENFTAKSRKTIPDDAFSASTAGSSEDDPIVMDETVVTAKRQGSTSNRFSRKNKDFSRPSSVEESRAKSRGETYTPPPAREPRFAEPKREAYKPRFADAKEQPQTKPPKMEEPSARTPRFAAPKREAYKPRFAEPVVEAEVDLPQVVDPAAKKSRIKKPSRTAPVVEAEAPAAEEAPVEEPAKKDRKNIFQRAGGKVAGAARGVKDLFDGEDEDTAPAWINDPDVGVSEPGLLESSSRTMGLDRLRQNKNKKSGTSALGQVQYWTDPNDGTTFVREVDSDEDELPAEVDMTGAEQLRKQSSYTVVKKAGTGEETVEKKAGFGFGDYLKAIGGSIKRAVTGDDMPDYIRNPPKNNFAMTLEMPEGMRLDQAQNRAQQAVADHFLINYHPDDIYHEESADGKSSRTGFKGDIKNLGSSMGFWMDRKNGIVYLNYDPDIIEWTPEDEEKKSPKLR